MRWLLFLFVLVIASSARGAEVNRVVVVAPEEVASRIRAELAALGFEVVDGELQETDTLEDLARSQDAAFALAVAVHAEGYEVTLRDRVTRKTLMREVVGATDPSESALRVVELLRASLLELRARHRVEGDVPADPKLAKLAEQTLRPAPRVTKIVRTPEPELTAMEQFGRDFASTDLTARGSIDFAGAWLFDGGGSGSGIAVEVAGGWYMPRYLQTRLTARYQGLPSVLEVPEGRVTFRAAQFGISTAIHFIDPADLFSPFLEVGGLFTWLHVEGTSPYRTLKGHDADAFAVVPFLAPGFLLGPRSWHFRARASLGIGLPIPALDITVRDAVAESWGRPLIFATWGFQYQFR